MLQHILRELNLSEPAISVYITLLQRGASSAKQLANILNIPRPSIYDYLKMLEVKGLVVERIEERRKVFQADDTRKVTVLLEDKVTKLRNDIKDFTQLLPSLLTQSNLIEPKIKFYPGVKGLKQAFSEVLLEKNLETTSIWPFASLVDVLGPYFCLLLDKKRIKKNIFIRGIWPLNNKVYIKTTPFLGLDKKSLREVRQAPKTMKWNMGYWQYNDKIIFISSRKEAFAFVIQSHEFTELQKMLFEQTWLISNPIAKD